ncbi:MAG: HNH endonuclease [Acidimicrobiia bacterium]|nr:HNH endonuclease [Acidimicrobiia bacterium]
MRWLALGLVLVACSNQGDGVTTTPTSSVSATASETTTVAVSTTVPLPGESAPVVRSTSAQIPSTSTASPSDPGADWVADLLSQLVILDGQVTVPYDRDDWGSGWSDADGDCLSTRHEVLMHEAAESVFLRDDGCLVTGGTWLAEFTGTVVSDPRDLDIDHFVPLANAHRSGAWEWSAETKRAYYNDLTDPRHLIAVTSSANRSKGSRGPDEWKPPEEAYWCTYADTWVDIKIRWELSVTTGEMNALQSMLSTCDGPPDLEDLQPAKVVLVATTAVPTAMVPSGTTVGNPGNSVNCGDFDSYAEAKEWFDTYFFDYGDIARLDSDGDGEPCESLPGGP